MAHSRTRQLDETFFALSDPTRRAMLARLAQGESTVADLSEPFDVSPPAISKQLRVLERAGLLRQDRRGRTRICRIVAQPLKEAAAWVEQYRRFWEARLDRLEDYLSEIQASPAQTNATQPDSVQRESTTRRSAAKNAKKSKRTKSRKKET